MAAPSGTENAGAYELAYAEAVRALAEQQAVIDNFRTRAGTLISGAAIATSFLGGAVLERGTSLWAWGAIGSFVILGLAVGAILWPAEDWEYGVSPRLVITDYVESRDPLSLPQIHRDLALHMDKSRLLNRAVLRGIVRRFRLAAALLMLELLCWVAALASQGVAS